MSFRIRTIRVGQLSANCYLVIDNKTSKGMIIDPGDDADYIIRICNDEKCKPEIILATHGHFDHILAVAELKLAYNIPFYIHKNDEFLVKNMQSSAKYFLGIDVDLPLLIDKFIKDKEIITICNNILEIIETPGHTPGSICLYAKKESVLFAGDLLFADGGVGRTDFSYSNLDVLNESIKKIFRFPGKTAIFPGHGRDSTLTKEKKCHRWRLNNSYDKI